MGFMDKLKGAAEKATAAMPVGASEEQIRQANRANKLAKQGIETPAHIDSMTATGEADATGSKEYEFALTINPSADGAAYAATTRQYIHPSASFEAGQDVTVKVDPDDSGEVILWGAARA
jgi:hypothetical protein